MNTLIENTMLISMPSGMEWLWVAIIALLLFGGKKIPELAKGIGRGIREFNDAKEGIKKEIENGAAEGKTKNTPPETKTQD